MLICTCKCFCFFLGNRSCISFSKTDKFEEWEDLARLTILNSVAWKICVS